MSFQIYTDQQNNITRQNLFANMTLANQGVFSIQCVATAAAAGSTAFVDYFTGQNIEFAQDDILTYVLAVGSNFLPPTGNVAIGLSATPGGALTTTLITNTPLVVTSGISDPIDSIVSNSRFLTLNLSGGVASGTVRAIITIWRRSLT